MSKQLNGATAFVQETIMRACGNDGHNRDVPERANLGDMRGSTGESNNARRVKVGGICVAQRMSVGLENLERSQDDVRSS